MNDKLDEEQKEYYLFFYQAIQDLNNALDTLVSLKETGNKISPIIFSAAFQFSLIQYAKPYNKNRRLIHDSKKHNLFLKEHEYVTEGFEILHKHILGLRDTFYAHSDMKVRSGKVYVEKTSNGAHVGHTQNIVFGTDEYKNIDYIIEMIENTLDLMDLELIKIKKNLINSKTEEPH